MAVVTMKALLESGVHFGHRTHRWHPHMKPYIFTERNGIHIINLQLTVQALEEAYNLVRDVVSEGGKILFVGTKRQAQETIQYEAARAGMPYVNARWLGGMLTNYRTIRERINELERLERMRDAGEFERLTKKEGLMLERKIEKLETRLSGIRNMIGLPDLLFVVDVRREETAVHEANLLEIPVLAMVDTNCDPRNIDYIIPSNDDAIRAIKLMVGKIADAVLEGKAMRKEAEEVEEAFVPPEMMVEEPQLSDEELLGEATLAKLREVEEDEVVEEEEPEAAADEAAEAEEEEAEPAAEGEEVEAAEPVAEAEEAPEDEPAAAEPAAEAEEEEAEPAAEGEQVEEAEPVAEAELEAVAEAGPGSDEDEEESET